jgi:hypothetical protein
VIVGLKLRCGSNYSGPNDLFAVREARTVADQIGKPVMIHVNTSYTPMDQILDVLRPGDIVTHKPFSFWRSASKARRKRSRRRQRIQERRNGENGGQTEDKLGENAVDADGLPRRPSRQAGQTRAHEPLRPGDGSCTRA